MAEPESPLKSKAPEGLVSISVVGLFTAGVASFVVAIASHGEPMERWIAPCIALVAAALAFGLLTNALLRD